MGGRATLVQTEDGGRRVHVRQLVPLGDHPQHGRRSDDRPQACWPAARPTGSSISTTTEVPPPADESAIVVVGSGNLGLVWFTGHDHRLTVEEMAERNPGLMARLVEHPGVGLALVRSSEFGAMAMSSQGVRFLDQDRVEGVDPDHALRRAHDHEPQARGRDDARAGHPAAQPVRPGTRRGGRVRGTDRVARRPGRPADEAVHPPSRPSGRSTRRSRSGPRPSTGTSGPWLSSIGIELGRPAGNAPRRRPSCRPWPEPVPRTDPGLGDRGGPVYGSAMNQTSLTPWPFVSPAALSAAK